MPPRPITATVAPGHTPAVWIAAPDARGHPAPEQACAHRAGCRRAARIDLCRVDHGVGRERAAGQDPDERRRPCRADGAAAAGPSACAQRRGLPRAGTERQRAARDGPRQDARDRRARTRRHAVPDLLHDAGAFVAEQHRERRAPSCRSRSPTGRSGTRRWPRSGPAPRRPVDRVDVDRFDVRSAPPVVDDGSSCCSCIHALLCAGEAVMLASAAWTSLTLRDLAAARYDEFVAALEAMVNVDCGSYSPTASTRSPTCARRGSATADGRSSAGPMSPRTATHRLGDLLIGRLRGTGGPGVLLVGHMDTVFDDGTAARASVLRSTETSRAARACPT